MKTKVVNLYKEPYDIYIGRAGKGRDGYYGNPFRIVDGQRGTTKEQFTKYFNERIQNDPVFKEKVLQMKGKILGCFCKQEHKEFWCHGDVYVEYLET